MMTFKDFVFVISVMEGYTSYQRYGGIWINGSFFSQDKLEEFRMINPENWNVGLKAIHKQIES